MNYLNSKRWKGPKNEKSVTKRLKFSNLKTQIPSGYFPTCFFSKVEQFLYITYESFKV